MLVFDEARRSARTGGARLGASFGEVSTLMSDPAALSLHPLAVARWDWEPGLARSFCYPEKFS